MDGLGLKHAIPDFITAGSPRGLRLKMLQTNAKLKGMARYFDISQDKDGRWIAWFYREIETFDGLLSDEPKSPSFVVQQNELGVSVPSGANQAQDADEPTTEKKE